MGQNISWEDSDYFGNNYSALHVTWVAITLFRTSHYQSVYCAWSLQSAHYCTVYWRSS